MGRTHRARAQSADRGQTGMNTAEARVVVVVPSLDDVRSDPAVLDALGVEMLIDIQRQLDHVRADVSAAIAREMSRSRAASAPTRPAPPAIRHLSRTLASAGHRLVYANSLNSRRAPVAQLDRASGFEPEGRGFNSSRAHHRKQGLRRQWEPRLPVPSVRQKICKEAVASGLPSRPRAGSVRLDSKGRSRFYGGRAYGTDPRGHPRPVPTRC